MRKSKKSAQTRRGEASSIIARSTGPEQKAAQRQFQKTRAKVIQSHARARGRRNQARRDAR
jgi:hypothetical protein